jgi:hypothetical protein
MTARYPGTCVRCKKPIVKGQLIGGESRAYFHENCDAPGARIENPGLPASAKQKSLIGELLDEREFTMGEASTLIDYLMKKPKRQGLAARLEAVA